MVAAVRGSAMIMPVHKMTAVLSTNPGTRPNEPSTAAFAPPAALSAKMPRQESATSIKMKHKKPITQSVPLSMPKNGGKIRFPAPKNMANKASPVIKVSFFKNAHLWNCVRNAYYDAIQRKKEADNSAQCQNVATKKACASRPFRLTLN